MVPFVKYLRIGRAALLLILPLLVSFSAPSNVERAYLESYLPIAKQESQRSGIPVSIKLGQALLESNSGSSVLAVRANNHFGIKCKSDWTGPRYFYTDDDRDEFGNLVPSCFRMYDSAKGSYQDHSDFLVESERYAELFELPRSDYKAWAEGLMKCGYATDPAYARKLIRKIEQHKLFAYDKQD